MYLSILRNPLLFLCLVAVPLAAARAASPPGGELLSPPTYQRPGTPEVGGIREMCLIYHGNNTRPEWTPDMILPYVAHVDAQGRPTDWLFDSFLFTEFATDNGAWLYHYKAGVQATAKDWAWLADGWFRKKTGLIGLEGAVENAGRILGDTNHQVNVVIAMPIPLRQVGQFGPFPDSTGKLDFSNDDDRLKALQWYIQRVLDHWRKANYKHLRLVGFYWTDESILPDNEAIVRATARYIHAQGYKLFWIPYFSAQGLGIWRELGIDGTIFQPNYFFNPDVAPVRFLNAAQKARAAECGVEIEFNKRVFESKNWEDRFYAYLDAGLKYGWMTNSLLGYYEGGGCLRQMVDTPGAGRQMYDALYRFVKGIYQPSGRTKLEDYRPPAAVVVPERSTKDNLALASKGAKVFGCVRIPGTPEEWPEKAIDGKATNYGGMSGFAYFPIPGNMTIELPKMETVARTQMLLWNLDERWFQYRIETSPDNIHWQPAVDKSQGKWRGWQVDNFTPRQARFVRVTGLHASIPPDFDVVEFEIYATPGKAP
jgi:hypothetical protein